MEMMNIRDVMWAEEDPVNSELKLRMSSYSLLWYIFFLHDDQVIPPSYPFALFQSEYDDRIV